MSDVCDSGQCKPTDGHEAGLMAPMSHAQLAAGLDRLVAGEQALALLPEWEDVAELALDFVPDYLLSRETVSRAERMREMLRQMRAILNSLPQAQPEEELRA